MRIEFTKMHGAGNDYIYVYTPEYPIENPAELSVRLSRPHFGIGSDGLILIGKSDKADFSMRIFNNDGSEAMMCGNGVRCVAKFVYDHHLTDKTTITVDTLSGIKVIELKIIDGKCVGATVDMGKPCMSNPKQYRPEGSPKEARMKPEGRKESSEYVGTFVSMGNPHYVIFVPEVENIDIAKEGQKLENHPMFPERCNIEFATVKPDGTIRMRVWERGSGITLACGTGACATAVAACLTGRRGRKSHILMDGGSLQIEWRESDGHIYMTGPAETVFEGSFEL